MFRKLRSFLCAFFLLQIGLIASSVSFAAALPVPALTEAVNDLAGVLSREVRDQLGRDLQRLRQGGGTQIAVLIVPELQDEAIEAYSIRVTDQWKLGDKDKDNGVLLLLAIKERRIRIEVGQGLEGVLTDAYANRIIQQGIQPYLRQGDFNSGVISGVVRIASYTDPDFIFSSVQGHEAEGDSRPSSGGLFSLPLLIIFGVIFLLSLFGGGGRGGPGSRYRRDSGWGAASVIAGALAGSMGGRSRGGGGGFGGGGGGFSGGGASGGW